MAVSWPRWRCCPMCPHYWWAPARKILPRRATSFDLAGAAMWRGYLPPQISSYRVRALVKDSQTYWPREWPAVYRRSPPAFGMRSSSLAVLVSWGRRENPIHSPQQSGSWLGQPPAPRPDTAATDG